MRARRNAAERLARGAVRRVDRDRSGRTRGGDRPERRGQDDASLRACAGGGEHNDADKRVETIALFYDISD